MKIKLFVFLFGYITHIISQVPNVVFIRDQLNNQQTPIVTASNSKSNPVSDSQNIITNVENENILIQDSYPNRDPALQNMKNLVKAQIINRSAASLAENSLPNDSGLPTVSAGVNPYLPSTSFLQKRVKSLRRSIFSFLQTSRAWDSINNPSNFFSTPYETNIDKLPKIAASPIIPWSGSYWPMRNGFLAVRYAKNSKNTIGAFNSQGQYLNYYNWKTSVNLYSQPSEHNTYYNTTGWQDYVNNYYSASEKYDLLLGDLNYTLTNALKNYGAYFADANGTVAGWMGICHGWTPASYNEKRPNQSVSVIAADGVTNITFYPDDLKGLASLFWANAFYYSDFVGGICRTSDTSTLPHDTSTGLWTDTLCSSVNPGSMLLVFGNQIGLIKGNLIFDPNADDEVWNQPVNGYSVRYYNLITKYLNPTAAGAKISRADAANSGNAFLKFLAKKSSSNATSYVGILFKVNYGFETDLSSGILPDVVVSGEWPGAIEIDENNNIVGGEWRYNSHPNFLWQPDPRYTALGSQDNNVKTFDGTIQNLNKITGYAQSSSVYRQPLKAVVKYLLDQAT